MNVVRSLLMLFLSCSSLMSFAQRGVRLAYIDMDEILENVDDYTTASLLLEKNVATWKEDIAVKKMELKGREEQLQAEKVLLTPELIEDRQNELSLFRSEIVALQTKYFGSQGNYIQQKNKLLKPIQDQVLSIVRQIAQERKYDFVFDRSSDLVMLYSAKNYDISALVLQRLNAQERIKTRKKQIEERKAKIEQRLKN
ncbi:OmpH family outer membrane protein [Flavobacteriaceae bacterium]|jgi:Skp family chaperone for outer membrane proteins|nr:OmpH family outer membrane protein [Flavobacteriaceae bacterium]MDA8924426.1 OmpH family outer membrane protein [Flavobacteriaceae bacterium]MDA9886570.1 OmpH family outer membrane protein [Flavobacteriaceae bacterium]MDA9985040.1 OmpH family outer membrane protein [Flavobacteriaceae bacterium]MDB2672670.1 OmpH family outer membrane protein [Flavobacteriaceae bacterium]